MFKSYSDATAQLPPDAKWSCSFGFPGEGGYCEYHRDAKGDRYTITNGTWDAVKPFAWTVRHV